MQHSNRAYNLFLSVSFTRSLRFHILHTCRNKLKTALLRIESKQKKIKNPHFVSRLCYYASYVYDIYCSYLFKFFLVLRRTLASLRKRDRKSFIFPALGRTNQSSLLLYGRHKPIQVFISNSCRYTHKLNTKYLQIITWYTGEKEKGESERETILVFTLLWCSPVTTPKPPTKFVKLLVNYAFLKIFLNRRANDKNFKTRKIYKYK